MNKRAALRGKLQPSLLVGLLLASVAAHGDDNLHFRGALVAKPCVVAPESERSEVPLGTLSARQLQERTAGKDFTLHLLACDSALAQTVSVTFTGSGSAQHQGLLALAPGSQAHGIAIGLETPEGTPVPLQVPTTGQQLVDGDNTLRFRAYVQPTGEGVGLGTFSAAANFELSYE